jgi:hypothetical protein
MHKTHEIMEQERLKYKSLKEFKHAHPKEYRFLVDNHLIHKLCEDTGWVYWTFDNCYKESLKFRSKHQWRINSPESYRIANKKGWFKECMPQSPRQYWDNKEKCLKKSLEYTSLITWEKNHHQSYSAAKYRGWLDECNAHMINYKLVNKTIWEKKSNVNFY